MTKLGDFTLQAGSPSFFSTMGTRLIRGRGITTEDRSGTQRVMVVSEGMAKRLWPNEDAIGKCVRVNADTAPCTNVVGIAEDVRRGSLSEPEFHYYMPIDQFARTQGGIFVRTQGPGRDAGRADPSFAAAVDARRFLCHSHADGDDSRQARRGRGGSARLMFTIFGALALVLAAIGLYSVIAYNVTQRMHEMGVRVALGAQGRDVIRLIVREGLTIVIPGVALGAVVALRRGPMDRAAALRCVAQGSAGDRIGDRDAAHGGHCRELGSGVARGTC